MLRAEFARVGMQLDLENRSVVDPMVIFYRMEPRDLGAAYRKYCGKTLAAADYQNIVVLCQKLALLRGRKPEIAQVPSGQI
jgi:hypothetical protein